MSKHALIIGNNKYRAGNTLKYCENDAKDMATKLRDIGFKVICHIDKTYSDMLSLITTFTTNISTNDFIVFFFSGHGTQLSETNYLVPIDNERLIEDPSIHPDHSISVQSTINSMMEKRPSAIIFLLDCCRLIIDVNQEIETMMSSADSENYIPNRTINSTLIVFACGPNQAALDKSLNGRNGLFTYHLLQHITEPELTLEQILQRVKRGVLRDTNGLLQVSLGNGLDTSKVHLNSLNDYLPEKEIKNECWLELQFHDQYKRSIRNLDEVELEMKYPPLQMDEKVSDRIAGSLLGLALGDALGAPVSYHEYEILKNNPVTDMSSGGTWGLEKGQFTDVTSIALCMAVSLIVRGDIHFYDQLVRYKWCFRYGYMTSTGQTFNTGKVKEKTIQEFESRQQQFAQKHRIKLDVMDVLSKTTLLEQFNVVCSPDTDLENGALMRLAPIPLFFFRDPARAIKNAGMSVKTTNDNVQSYDACRYYAALIVAIMHGYSRDDLLDDMFYEKNRVWFGENELDSEILRIAKGSYKKQQGYVTDIRGSKSVTASLEAALWAFWAHQTSFEEGALAAVNLGDDTCTTAAIYGQLAGAFYGSQNLPGHWLECLYAQKFIYNISRWILYGGKCWYQSDERKNFTDDAYHRYGLVLSLEECETWSCEDVTHWLRSKGVPFSKYVDDFKKRGLDGYHLINTTNEKDLFPYPRTARGNQGQIFKAINELKEAARVKFYRGFHTDDFGLPITIFGTSKNISSCVIRRDINFQHDYAYNQIVSWVGELPEGTIIDKIVLIPPNNRYDEFLKQISVLKLEENPNEFESHIQNERYLKQRQAVLNRLQSLIKQVKHQQPVSIARLWYRCDVNRMKTIITNGFNYKDIQNYGNFGQGIYLSSSAKEALYEQASFGCIIMCYVIILSPFPVISADAHDLGGMLDLRFYRRKAHLNHQCHYIPVARTMINNNIYDLPPRNGVSGALYDQVVIFNPDYILPQCVLHLKPKPKLSNATLGYNKMK